MATSDNVKAPGFWDIFGVGLNSPARRDDSSERRSARLFASEIGVAAVPETDEERAALRRLAQSFSRKSQKDKFINGVLVHLGVVRIHLALQSFNGPAGDKLSHWLRLVRKIASKIERVASDLEKFNLTSPPRSIVESFPASFWQCPAEDMALIGQLTRRVRSLESMANLAKLSKRPRKKRSPRLETEQILMLMDFVRQNTGTPHWNDLAILLRRPCNDRGMSAARLRSIWTFHKLRHS